MNNLVLRWLWLPFWMQICIFLLISCVVAGGFWAFGGSAVYQQRDALMRASLLEEHQYRTVLSALRTGETLFQIDADILRLQQQRAQAEHHAFSLPEMLRQSGGELESWQPDRQGGRLLLNLDWAQFQALFHYFHQHAPAVTFPQFQLKRENDVLRLQLSVAFHHEH